jgi:rhodanese-related sulfurtransferase
LIGDSAPPTPAGVRIVALNRGRLLRSGVERHEWDQGHVPDSLFTPWHDIVGIPEGLDPTRPTAVICARGMRAATAASLLKLHGAQDVIHVVDGGVPALAAAGVQLTPSVAGAARLAVK